MPRSRAPRRGRIARQRSVIIVLGALLFAAYGTIIYTWFGDRVPPMAVFALFSLTVVALAWLGVRALEHEQLSAARLRVSINLRSDDLISVTSE